MSAAVVDSSVVVAALIDAGPVGSWAEALLASGPLAAPHLMPVEVANVLRRAAMAGEISGDVAALAHEDLLSLRLELFPYSLWATRVWELRSHISPPTTPRTLRWPKPWERDRPLSTPD